MNDGAAMREVRADADHGSGGSAILAAAAHRYQPLRLLSHPDTARDPAARLVRRTMDDLAAAGAVPKAGERAAARLRNFVDVVVARRGLAAGAFEEAADRLERVVGRDVRDLYAQRLLALARARRSHGRLEIDEWLAEHHCPRPFTTAETMEDGQLRSCCDAWMPTALGSAFEQPVDRVWNGAAAREIRRSVLDGDFAHCSRMFCPHIAERRLPTRADAGDVEPEADGGVWRRRGPSRVLLSHDRSCNLSCPSCRTRLIVAGKRQQTQLDAYLDDAVVPLLADAEIVKVTGSGDPFGSRHFRDVLLRLKTPAYRHIQIDIQTNGILLDQAAWRTFDFDHRVARLWVSLDAATPETYAQVRRGGDFARLLDNLAFLAQKRRDRQLAFLRLDFVVQAKNFREIPAFLEIARRIEADGVSLQRLRNWGTFDEATFHREDIASSTHPSFDEFLAVLADPRLDDARIEWGNLQPMRERARRRPRTRSPLKAPGGLLVVHVGRCGSTLLAEWLRQAVSGLFIDGEIFAPTRFDPTKGASPLDVLATRIARARPRRYQFEVKLRDLATLDVGLSELVEGAHALGVDRTVLLIRKNLLRGYLSAKRADVTRTYHVADRDLQPPRPVRFRVDPWHVIRAVEAQAAAVADARAALDRWRPLELSFEEDLLAAPDATIGRLCGMFGEPPVAVPPPTLRPTTSAPLRALVENYDELAAAVAATDHAWMLAARTGA